jgi:predicted  nucleic acid-binding Zn-ribbon protein
MPGQPAFAPPGRREDARLRDLELRVARAEQLLAQERSENTRLGEAAAATTARFEAFERDARALGKGLGERQEGLTQRIETLEKTAAGRLKDGPRLQAVEERLDRGEKRQRTAEDDVSMALRTLSERGEKFHQHIEEIGEKIAVIERTLQEKTSQTRREADDIRAQFDVLQAALEEKTIQGRREAEDIRSQIAPLLEAPDTHARLVAEFERMRDSLAEALGELSEKLRNAVRGE